MDLNDFLIKVENANIVSSEQMKQMRKISLGYKFSAQAGEGMFDELDKPSRIDDNFAIDDTEAPRLVRGFHDILISIGIVAALSGLWTISGPWITVIALLILTEIFVLRQKLAFPAFVLTGFFVTTVLGCIGTLEKYLYTASTAPLIAFGGATVALSLFYWRYKIPVTLALLICAGFATLFSVFLFFLDQQNNSMEFLFKEEARLIGGVGLVLTVCQFLVAMRFDAKDPKRLTRNSDVAFWLHLAVAPLLMYSLFLLLFGSSGFWWAKEPSGSDAIIALLVVTFLMAIGIIIDRRAFVTSGLISLGVALFILTKDAGVTATNISALSLLGVGVIVLLLGTGWQKLRGFALNFLPQSWKERLPPIVR